jgi:hypothetical protein
MGEVLSQITVMISPVRGSAGASNSASTTTGILGIGEVRKIERALPL